MERGSWGSRERVGSPLVYLIAAEEKEEGGWRREMVER
jgi:hypothetical protein